MNNNRLFKIIRRIGWPALYALAAAVFVAYETASQWGIAVSYDSMVYLERANEIFNHGPRLLFRSFSIEQPPFYPVLLSLGIPFFGGELTTWATILNIAFAACTMFLVWEIAERNCKSPLYAHLAAVSCLFSRPLLNMVWFYVWTEPAFIVLALVALTFCVKDNPSHLELGSAATAIILACATRYTGVVLILIAAIASFRTQSGRRATLKRLFATVVVPSLCFALYALRNHRYSGTYLGPRHKAIATLADNLGYVKENVLDWFGAAAGWNGVILLAVFATIAVIGAICLFRKVNFSKRTSVVPREIWIHVLFAAVYIAFVVITSTTTAYQKIGQRLLAPAFPSTIIVFFYCMNRCSSALSRRGAAVFSAVLVMAFLPVAYAEFGTMKSLRAHGMGLRSEAYSDEDMKSFLAPFANKGHAIFSPDDRFFKDAVLHGRQLPRTTHYQSDEKTGLTPENILERIPEMDGALLILRTDAIPDGFVNLFDSRFPGEIERLSCFRTGCVWEIRKRKA